MELLTLIRNWKIMVPTVTVSVMLWAFGFDSFPRPVFANELDSSIKVVQLDYKADLKTLNQRQLTTRKEFVKDKLERVEAKELELEQKEWEFRQKRQRPPEFLPELQQKVVKEKKELEATLDSIHAEEIKLNATPVTTTVIVPE